MEPIFKPFVHLPIDAVDTVVRDLESRYDAETHDRYATFAEARDAALTSIEIMLDEADYDDEGHREELERMAALLEAAETFDDLANQPEYRAIVRSLAPARTVAA